ncbi:aminoglycoside phosphotransferase family protein [Sphaerisporangium fuscum]|uniref:aminoglycoside phosphotransferase family protein n=1 Tax=Sphaerisporangium fuscum TaxID=2835868 RepID=UPI001BDD906A|nr:aminoglycoside phosphotransferase family protein [Sphaerisporangium fuscum]
MSEVVEDFGTGFLRTTIVRCDEGGYRWIRRPGPGHGGPLREPDPAVLAAVRPVAAGPVSLTFGEPVDGGGMAYRTTQARSLAGMFLRHGRNPGEPDLERIAADTLVETAAALARLHAVPLPRAGMPSPEGPRRLLSWLRGGDGDAGPAQFRRHAAEILGRDRMALAGAWCEPSREGRRVLLHGAPSAGILLPLIAHRDGGLLTGEDLGAGPPESDAGWLIGELVEFRELARSRQARQGSRGGVGTAGFDALIRCVLDGYGGVLDAHAVGRQAAVRFLTHAHDFATYVGWHEMLLETLRLVAGVIDAADDGRLLPSPAGVSRL